MLKIVLKWSYYSDDTQYHSSIKNGYNHTPNSMDI